MSPTLALILFIVGVVLFLAGLYLSYQSSQAQKTFDEAKRRLDEERADLEKRANRAEQGSKKASQSDKSEAKPSQDGGLNAAQEEELRKQVSASRDKLAKQREKNQHITRERDDLKKRVADLESQAKQPAHDAHALVDLRMELAEAKQEASLFKQRIEELERSGKKSKKKVEAPSEPVAEPVVEQKPSEPMPVAASESSEDQATYIEELKGRIERGEREMREQQADLKKRLKKQGREIEHQMRRADNNDKAYRITQRELDAARERINMLTEQLDRARFAASSTSHAQDHPGLVDIAPLAISTGDGEEEMTMESPEITQDLIEHDAALAEASDIISEMANESSQVIEEESVVQDDTPLAEEVEDDALVAAELPDTPTEVGLPETAPVELEQSEPETESLEQEASDSEQEDKEDGEAPGTQDELAEQTREVHSPEDVAQTEVDRAEITSESTGNLSESSAVDEAWGDLDLDDEDDL